MSLLRARFTSQEEGQEKNSTPLEIELKKVFNEQEYRTLMTSLYVLINFRLDFATEDYNCTNQDVLETLVYNIGSVIQKYYHDATYSRARSYDSFYSDIKCVCDHNYGEWNVVKDATAEDYGVQMKSCTHCGESMYEAISKIVTEDNTPAIPDDNTPGTPDTDLSGFTASIFKEGSVVVIVFATVAMVAVGFAIYFYVRLKNVSSVYRKDDD